MSQPSDRSRMVTLLLSSLLGVFGAHRFYVGKIGTGILQACTFGGLGIWYVVDNILVATGAFRDVEGRPVINWQEAATMQLQDQEPTNEMWEEIDSLRAEVHELSERVDYTERLLTRSRSEDYTK